MGLIQEEYAVFIKAALMANKTDEVATTPPPQSVSVGCFKKFANRVMMHNYLSRLLFLVVKPTVAWPDIESNAGQQWSAFE